MTKAHSFHMPSQEKPPFVRDRLTWLSYGMLVYFSYFQTILGPVLPYLRAELHLSYGVAAWHFSMFGGGMILAGLTADLLSYHLGRTVVFWGGGGGMALGGVIIALGHQVWMTLVGAFVMGSFGTLLLVGIQAILADQHDHRQGIALAEANIGASLGAGLSALCVAGFAFVGMNWRWTLIVPALALIACFATNRREDLKHKPRSDERYATPSTLLLSFKPLPTRFWISWLVVVFVVSTEWCMTFWGASFLQSKLHLDGGVAALLLDLYLATTIAGRFIGSRLRRVTTGSRLLFLALGGTLLGFSFFWLAPTVLLTAGGLLMTGVSISNLWPQAITLAFVTASEQPDQASARVSLGAGLAICIAPLLLGTLANMTGLQVAYGIEPCLIIIATVTSGIAVTWGHAQETAKRGHSEKL